MSNEKVKKWIADSLNKELGTDPETGDGANVEVLSWKIVECMFNGKCIIAQLKAWGEDESFEGCYFSHSGWELEGDRIPDPSEVWGDLDRKK